MQDVDQRLTKDVDRLCTDLAELIPTMVSALHTVALNCPEVFPWVPLGSLVLLEGRAVIMRMSSCA